LEAKQRLRAERIDVRLAREAYGKVLPFKRQLSEWQAEVSFLQAKLAFGSTGEMKEAASKRAEAIAVELDDVRSQLETLKAQVPEQISRHSRFEDAIRAVASLEARLRLSGPQ